MCTICLEDFWKTLFSAFSAAAAGLRCLYFNSSFYSVGKHFKCSFFFVCFFFFPSFMSWKTWEVWLDIFLLYKMNISVRNSLRVNNTNPDFRQWNLSGWCFPCLCWTAEPCTLCGSTRDYRTNCRFRNRINSKTLPSRTKSLIWVGEVCFIKKQTAL